MSASAVMSKRDRWVRKSSAPQTTPSPLLMDGQATRSQIFQTELGSTLDHGSVGLKSALQQIAKVGSIFSTSIVGHLPMFQVLKQTATGSTSSGDPAIVELAVGYS